MGNSVIYIGNNFQTFENIESRIRTETAEMCTSIPAMIEHYELIILDGVQLSFYEIIEIFEKLGSAKIKKRIKPENTNFFIGSDSSGSGGEVVQLL
jgi:hypothetical protein